MAALVMKIGTMFDDPQHKTISVPWRNFTAQSCSLVPKDDFRWIKLLFMAYKKEFRSFYRTENAMCVRMPREATL